MRLLITIVMNHGSVPGVYESQMIKQTDTLQVHRRGEHSAEESKLSGRDVSFIVMHLKLIPYLTGVLITEPYHM
jgi:hypothetical protein